MFGLETLDVLFAVLGGLFSIYLVFGLAVTAIVEAVGTLLQLRQRNLRVAIQEILAGKSPAGTAFVEDFYQHPLVQSLSKGDGGRPSAIDKDTFARAVVAILQINESTKDVRAALGELPDGSANRIAQTLRILEAQGAKDVAQLRAALEVRFDATMARATGWFKRKTQLISFLAASTLVVAGNIDSIQLIGDLTNNPEARLALLRIAEDRLAEVKKEPTAAAASEERGDGDGAQSPEVEAAHAAVVHARAEVSKAKAALADGGLSFGWTTTPQNAAEVLKKSAGLAVSIFAIMLGAPFWFDVLEKFMNVRNGGGKAQAASASKET